MPAVLLLDLLYLTRGNASLAPPAAPIGSPPSKPAGIPPITECTASALTGASSALAEMSERHLAQH
ncbi:hypothetical protein Vi05172_g7076 [Venturia inaequalis]|nr:hypothetical protein Vi05172_g7076 [Venturia inaequalis]